MADLTITPADVAPVLVREQFTVPAAVALTEGKVVYVTTGGTAALADGSASGTAAAAAIKGVCVQKATTANETVTCVRQGLVDLGDALGDLAIGASVYLSDTDTGVMGDTAGTSSVVVGTVVPGWGATTPDKLLRVNL